MLCYKEGSCTNRRSDFSKSQKLAESPVTLTVQLRPVVRIEHYEWKAGDSSDHRRIFDGANNPHGFPSCWADELMLAAYHCLRMGRFKNDVKSAVKTIMMANEMKAR